MTANQHRGGIALAVMLAILTAFAFDQPIARAMASIDPRVLRVAAFVTWFGQGGVILYPAGALIILGTALRYLKPGLRARLDPAIRAVTLIFVIVAAAGLADDALKIIFGRARPYRWLAGDMSGFGFFRYGAKFASFPSGHTTTSVAAAAVFGTLWPRFRVTFLATALAIAISRIALDVHYLSDVIAGAALGWLAAEQILGLARRRNFLSFGEKPDILT